MSPAVADRSAPQSSADQRTSSYDQVPYESFPFPQTHPDRLATIAALFGAKPANVERCRVLELGCASGGNLIPMASVLPGSEFLGIDLSQRQIAAGQETVSAIGLSNLELRHASILDVTPDWGKFDYIIAHGIYSWVPNAVQEKILRICSDNLAPQGVAYVSYNTYPGWHLRGMIRDMMHYHASRFTEPGQRLREARALVDFLARAVPADNNPFGLQLRKELEGLGQQSDNYLYHEQLEDVNEPIYFFKFVERAKEAGLQYLGEADFRVMTTWGFAPEIERTLHQLAADVIQMEQYMDFVRNRTFRQTLLCHKDVTLSRNITPNHLMPMYLASSAKPAVKDLDVRTQESADFTNANGLKLTTSDPMTKAAMVALSSVWPHALSMTELHDRVRANFESAAIQEASTIQGQCRDLANRLLKCFVSDVVEVSLHAPRFDVAVGERPATTALVRHQARKSNVVTTIRHQAIRVGDAQRHILQCLDGKQDRPALLARLTSLVKEGVLVVQQEGKRVEDAETLNKVLKVTLEESLEGLARLALLCPVRAGS